MSVDRCVSCLVPSDPAHCPRRATLIKCTGQYRVFLSKARRSRIFRRISGQDIIEVESEMAQEGDMSERNALKSSSS